MKKEAKILEAFGFLCPRCQKGDDWPTEKLSDNLRERSSLQSATQIKDSKQPAVYFRKRFRRPAGMLPLAPKEKQIIASTPCSISSDHVVGGIRNVKQPRGRRFEGPLWFNYDEGVSKMFWNMESLCTAPSASPGTANHDATDVVTIRVETIVRFLSLLCFAPADFSADQVWSGYDAEVCRNNGGINKTNALHLIRNFLCRGYVAHEYIRDIARG
ncbi:hypothetical protein KIW84_013744 [Lathyrus oleraceus]|uniref:Uncharacterized protein n=1 Tax=Pisum sativum TaxID=3888 RepID=A0A9D5GY84_PEA|nr:hypothetical protein KIW84_013744 [Pisum sativum]